MTESETAEPRVVPHAIEVALDAAEAKVFQLESRLAAAEAARNSAVRVLDSKAGECGRLQIALEDAGAARDFNEQEARRFAALLGTETSKRVAAETALSEARAALKRVRDLLGPRHIALGVIDKALSRPATPTTKAQP